jgi:exonuclease III
VIVSTINVNGIRAAIKQRSSENLGLLPWLAGTAADVVCLQETRADDLGVPHATPGLAARASAARVERAAAYALRWSDHARMTVEYG